MSKRWILTAALAAAACLAYPAAGSPLGVFADSRFQPALNEIAPSFSERTGFEVELSLGPSAILVEQIRAGEPVDLFFPAGESFMRAVMALGLVDVALKRNILQLPQETTDGTAGDPVYTSAAVLNNANQRIAAMAFLEFLTTDEARDAFARQGFALP